ncbi:MAG TPA: PHP domain-containing protein [Steroidobacteraceae bacterium]|jgi:3',5'-nucleoside bisphosphate phosphatase
MTAIDARIDLHTHSNCSDGVLAPAALVALAAQRQVALLALTDHDTAAGCDAARAACQAHAIGFVPGVELTCLWRGREIHVIGLDIDPAHAPFIAHCATVLELRRQRVAAMGERLSRAGLPGEALAAEALAASAPTRAHLARGLCARGLAASMQAAFDRWLGRGQPGYVAANWPQLAIAVQCIVAAAGVAVLAHPHRYQVSSGVLRELLTEFKAAGGAGLEVSLAGMGPNDADRVATLARRFELAGSIGSDFHEPGLPWRPLGRFAKLPERITPIMARLGPVAEPFN